MLLLVFVIRACMVIGVKVGCGLLEIMMIMEAIIVG